MYIYVDLIKKHFRNIERTLISEGPYETAPDFINHKIDASKWVSMSLTGTIRALKNFWGKYDFEDEDRSTDLSLSPNQVGSTTHSESMNEAESNLDCPPKSSQNLSEDFLSSFRSKENSNSEFPNFAETSLPANMSVDWDSARYYLNNFANTVQKSNVYSNSYIIRSRSKVDSVHAAKCSGKQVKCPCERYRVTRGNCRLRFDFSN